VVNSIPEFMGNLNSRIGIDDLKKNEIDKIGIEVFYKKLNPQIFLP